MKNQRHYTLWDKLCLGFDQAIRALNDNAVTSGHRYPADKVTHDDLSDADKKHAAALMRINHAGEICAQALYHGQAMVSKSTDVQEKMQQAAIEEGDHLAWCKRRIDELGSHTSYVNPLWYGGSFCIGMIAGMIGDAWSLGFVAETEKQVVKHLQSHLHLLPKNDERSYKIISQMEKDEAKHRIDAIDAGAKELPEIIKKAMSLTAKVMVKTAYYI